MEKKVTRQQVDAVKLTDSQVDSYLSTYPEFKPLSIIMALKTVIAKHGNLDAVTVDYHVRASRFAGLAMGKMYNRNTRRYMKQRLDDSLH